MCFPVNITKYLRAAFFMEHPGGYLFSEEFLRISNSTREIFVQKDL